MKSGEAGARSRSRRQEQEQTAAPSVTHQSPSRLLMLGALASPPAAWQVNDPRLSVRSFSELRTPTVNDPGLSAEVSINDRAGGDACGPSREVHLDFVTKVNL